MSSSPSIVPASVVPFIPSTAPFSPEQRAWLNGYLVGLLSNAHGHAAAPPAEEKPARQLLILFGSQTGSAESLARKIGKESAGKGFAPRVMEMNALTPADLVKESALIIVTSTWGDGEPPDNAATFFSALQADDLPGFTHLHYAILGLGDKNYSDFCGCGRKLDERLERLQAKRLTIRCECDTDFEKAAGEWIAKLWPLLDVALPDVASKEKVQSSEVIAPDTVEAKRAGYGRKNPFSAELLANRMLNREGSSKETRHFEIHLEGSGLSYETGDALGVVPSNCPRIVTELVAALGCTGNETVADKDQISGSLMEILTNRVEIRQPATEFLQAMAQKKGGDLLKGLLLPERKSDLNEYLFGREIIDLLLEFPEARWEPGEFISVLRKLQPRLYSISSSPKMNAAQVHLTVAAVRYESNGRKRNGVCSTFLADRVHGDVRVPVFVQTSHGFRLPTDTSRPVIMVGPGTGIAPFRAFLQEREATGATGKNWLFFGDQRRDCDFLYEEELNGMKTRGTLSRLDTAFSRDQKEKVYVQDRMIQSARELWDWLENGASFYVCGDAKRMARDVDNALHEVAKIGGGKTTEQAADYIQNLKKEKRYQRDVY
ncbi:MAG: sulfite reductase subunit alpha [Verrucomicrobiales bacterium]